MRYPVRSFHLLYVFARSYWLVTGLITAVSFYIYWAQGPAALRMLIYLKLITSAIMMVANYRRQFPNDVFYLNFGVSLTFLTGAAVGLDIIFWALGLIIVR